MQDDAAMDSYHRLTSDHRFQSAVRDARTSALREFRVLWSAYRAALAQPFGKDRAEDEAIRTRVDEAFDALDALSKEG